MKKQCYTIVELLVVIAIMAIIVAVSIPGLNNLINGNKVERAAKQLAAAIGKARAEAIVTNRKVAMLFPVQDSNIRYNYVNSSYAIVVLKKNDDTDFDTEKNNDFKWERLPGKTFLTVFRGDINSSSDFFEQENLKKENLSNVDGFKKKVKVGDSESKFNRILKNSGNTFEIPMLIFNPDGSLNIHGLGKFNIIITEGLIGSSTSTVMPLGDKDEKRPAGAIGFEVNQFTGRVKYHETL